MTRFTCKIVKGHTPDCLDKYVYLVQGGELHRNPSIRRLFEQYNFKGAGAHNQNGGSGSFEVVLLKQTTD
jgi:hypothetical protein